MLPNEGAWRGQLACGPVLSRPGGPGNAAFTAELAIEIQGRRIRWTRSTALINETVVGTFNAQGHFSAEGQGERKDRAEIWLGKSSGACLPRTRRIEGRLQILRPKCNTCAWVTAVWCGSAAWWPTAPDWLATITLADRQRIGCR